MKKSLSHLKTLATVNQTPYQSISARLEARHAHRTAYAHSLGHCSLQQAHQQEGTGVLAAADAWPVTGDGTPTQRAVEQFIELIALGWKTELACQCAHDTVYDQIALADFASLCAAAVRRILRGTQTTGLLQVDSPEC